VHDREGRVITAFFEHFILVACYVPNSGVYGCPRLEYRVKEWDLDFKKYMADLKNSGKPVILCGDLNVCASPLDLFSADTKRSQAGYTKGERESFISLLRSGYTDAWRYFNPNKVEYSYWASRQFGRMKGQGGRPDYFLATKAMMWKSA
jgi:exodeoxyribonuclease III